ncbi:hypothetical protein ABPG74_015787 [Tetrahymena malaccensis]
MNQRKNQPQQKKFNPAEYVRPGVTEDEVIEIKEAFDLFDMDLGGTIDPSELQAAMRSLGFEAKNQTIYKMIADLDTDQSGQINFSEFLNLMTARISDRDSREDIRKVYLLFNDENGVGISIKQLRRIAQELGEQMDDTELQEMIERADSNGDGLVTEDDFYNIMTKKNFV